MVKIVSKILLYLHILCAYGIFKRCRPFTCTGPDTHQQAFPGGKICCAASTREGARLKTSLTQKTLPNLLRLQVEYCFQIM